MAPWHGARPRLQLDVDVVQGGLAADEALEVLLDQPLDLVGALADVAVQRLEAFLQVAGGCGAVEDGKVQRRVKLLKKSTRRRGTKSKCSRMAGR